MRNYLLGFVSGLGAAALFVIAPNMTWYIWLLFIISSVLIAFSVDVFFGSRVEHQVRAGWMGLILFGGMGVVFQAVVWTAAL